jgi:molecular chaperone GrpE
MSQQEEKGFSVVDRRLSFDDDEEGDDVEAVESKPTYVEKLERQLEQAEQQVSDIKAQYKEALDEFENAKARSSRDAAIEIRKGRKMVLADMLEVLDNLERALESARSGESDESILDGVQLVRDQFVEKLESLGVHRVPSLGDRFDPEVHQAISTVPVEDEEQDGVVVGVVKEGYRFGDELLRPAMVAVGKGPGH